MIDKEKLFETALATCNDAKTSNALLALRIVFGAMMFIHGLGKLVNFSMLMPQFPDPLGIGDGMSLALSMLAETLGSIAIVAGFLTRPAAAVLLVNLAVALVAVHGCDIFGAGELAFVYLAVIAVLFYMGAGGKSVDAAIMRRRNKA